MRRRRRRRRGPPSSVGCRNRASPPGQDSGVASDNPATYAAFLMRTQLDGGRRPGVVLAVCSLATFLAFLDVTIVNIAFPAITRSFGSASLADLSWVFGAYNVVFAALLIPAGRLADLFGRRRIFLVGLSLFAV